MCLLFALDRAGTFLDQILGAGLFLLREFQLGLGLLQLGLGLIDLLMLAVDLRLDVVDIGLRDRHLRLGLARRNDIVAIVDPRQQVAGVDVLVVGNPNFLDVTADLRRNGEASRSDEGVVGGFVIADAEPVDNSADHGNQHQAGYERCQEPVLAKAVEQGRR